MHLHVTFPRFENKDKLGSNQIRKHTIPAAVYDGVLRYWKETDCWFERIEFSYISIHGRTNYQKV